MKIYNNLNINKKFKNSVLAIGNFDGVHLGHHKVISEAKKKAQENKIKLGAMTFEPVPVMFFNKKVKNHRINNIKQKILLLNKEKLDFLIVVKFNKKFAKITAQDFIQKVIIKKISAKYIFVSKNFRFGKKRRGNVSTLKNYENKEFFKTHLTKALNKKNKIISSTRIRKLISSGKIEDVNRLLGREWNVEGKIIEGDKRGRKIGFPTCNIEIKDYVIPKLGVYSVKVKIDKILRKGIANIGYRPTFNGKKLLLEVNIFGINKNLYKKIISVNFVKFIRPEVKFKDIQSLKKQIKIDIKKAKK